MGGSRWSWLRRGSLRSLLRRGSLLDDEDDRGDDDADENNFGVFVADAYAEVEFDNDDAAFEVDVGFDDDDDLVNDDDDVNVFLSLPLFRFDPDDPDDDNQTGRLDDFSGPELDRDRLGDADRLRSGSIFTLLH